jgi:hypothetical protein
LSSILTTKEKKIAHLPSSVLLSFTNPSFFSYSLRQSYMLPLTLRRT